MLIFHGESLLVVRELNPEGTHRGTVSMFGSVEEGVPVGQEAVPGSEGLANEVLVLLRHQPRFAALGLDMGVTAEERLICSRLRAEITLWAAEGLNDGLTGTNVSRAQGQDS
jgi:hypothetical protein